MHFKATINGEKHSFNIPTFWTGVTVRQFQALATAKTKAEELAALTPLDADAWQDYFDQVSLRGSLPLANAISFLSIPPNLDKIPIPPEVYVLGRVVKPLKKVEKMRQQAFHTITAIAKGKGPEELIQILHEIAGHGLAQSWMRGKYDEGVAADLAEMLLNFPITTVYPIAHFFWFAAQTSAANGQPRLMRHKTKKARRNLKKRVRQLWTNSARSIWSKA